MICLSCKKQMPDDISVCPHCGTEVHHKHQLNKEISFRRWQRWFFYGLAVLIFIGMGALLYRLYSLNTKLLIEVANVRGEMNKTVEEVKQEKEALNNDKAEFDKLRSSLELEIEKLDRDLNLEKDKLNTKTSEYAKELQEKTKYKTDYDDCLIDYSTILANYSSLLESTAIGISNTDIAKFKLADFNLGSTNDTDGDGLSDVVEMALNTDVKLADSDSDSYTDKDESLGGFNPLGQGALPLDDGFASKNQGRIFKQVESDGYYWYIGRDLKRYFLGKIDG